MALLALYLHLFMFLAQLLVLTSGMILVMHIIEVSIVFSDFSVYMCAWILTRIRKMTPAFYHGWLNNTSRFKNPPHQELLMRSRHRRRRRRRRNRLLTRFSLMALSSTIQDLERLYVPTLQDHSYDTDSYLIGIDDHASYVMSPYRSDFVGDLRPTKTGVNGVAGTVQAVARGTLRWHWLDDQGVRHRITIPNAYYVPALPIRLLSPQHLAQVLEVKEHMRDGTFGAMFAHRFELTWYNRQYKKTIPLNENNVAVMRSAPGYTSFVSTIKDEPVVFQATHLVSDDEQSTVDQRRVPDPTTDESLTETNTDADDKVSAEPTTPIQRSSRFPRCC